jgi:hypothetical protein
MRAVPVTPRQVMFTVCGQCLSLHAEGLINGPFMPHIDLCEPCCFTEVPDGPQTFTVNVLWLQEEGAQIPMSG